MCCALKECAENGFCIITMCKETKYYVSANNFNSLLQLEHLLYEQVGRVKFCSDNKRLKI